MASQKEETEFLEKIDELVSGYEAVKAKSIAYMRDYGREDLKQELLQALKTFKELVGREMMLSVGPSESFESEEEVESLIMEE